MSDAPERVWVKEGHDSWGQYGHWYAHGKGGGTEYVRADRIAELEAELAIAVADLERLVYLQSGNPCTGTQAEKWLGDAITTIAELKGQNDEW